MRLALAEPQPAAIQSAAAGPGNVLAAVPFQQEASLPQARPHTHLCSWTSPRITGQLINSRPPSHPVPWRRLIRCAPRTRAQASLGERSASGDAKGDAEEKADDNAQPSSDFFDREFEQEALQTRLASQPTGILVRPETRARQRCTRPGWCCLHPGALSALPCSPFPCR